MLALGLAMLGAGFAIFASWRERQLLKSLAPRGSTAVVRLIQTAPEVKELGEASLRVGAAAPVRRIVECARAESSTLARAAVGEELSDLDAALTRAADPLNREARVSLTVGMFSAVLEIVRGIGSGPEMLPWAVTAFLIGLVGAAVATQAGRRSRQDAVRYRAEYDRLVRALEERFE